MSVDLEPLGAHALREAVMTKPGGTHEVKEQRSFKRLLQGYQDISDGELVSTVPFQKQASNSI